MRKSVSSLKFLGTMPDGAHICCLIKMWLTIIIADTMNFYLDIPVMIDIMVFYVVTEALI